MLLEPLTAHIPAKFIVSSQRADCLNDTRFHDSELNIFSRFE